MKIIEGWTYVTEDDATLPPEYDEVVAILHNPRHKGCWYTVYLTMGKWWGDGWLDPIGRLEVKAWHASIPLPPGEEG